MTARADGDDASVAAGGRIVVGYDESEGSRRAVRWAAVEAHRRHLVLRIVTAFGPDYIFTTDEECREYTEKVAGEAMSEANGAAPDITVEHQGYRDLPAPVLREESRTADLLVVGSRGRGGFTGLLLGSVSRQCVHRSSCPVVVIRPPEPDDIANADAPRAGEAPHPDSSAAAGLRLVVGVDGSPSSNAALLWAADEAESTGAVLEVIHTWEWLTSAGWAVVPSDFDPGHEAQTVLDRAIEPVRALHPGIEIAPVVAEGQAADLLTKASEEAALLVVGCRGYGEVSGLLLGSVSDYCATHAHCPVLVMRGPRADAPDGK